MKANAQRLIATRLGFALLTLLLVSAMVFAITGLLPGDAAQQALGQAATPEQVAALRHQFGLATSRCCSVTSSGSCMR
jgi:peptide/nickel transport system permease protein